MSNNIKHIEIEGRRFGIKKFDAKTSLKVSKLIIAKILPVFDQFVPLLSGGDVNNIQKELTTKASANIEEFINLESISKALDMMTDEDIDKIIDVSLKHCYEQLAAGQTQVLSPFGVYSVPDVEDDPILVMRLTVEAIMWSIAGFFDVNRLSSILKPLAGILSQSAPM